MYRQFLSDKNDAQFDVSLIFHVLKGSACL